MIIYYDSFKKLNIAYTDYCILLLFMNKIITGKYILLSHLPPIAKCRNWWYLEGWAKREGIRFNIYLTPIGLKVQQLCVKIIHFNRVTRKSLICRIEVAFCGIQFLNFHCQVRYTRRFYDSFVIISLLTSRPIDRIMPWHATDGMILVILFYTQICNIIFGTPCSIPSNYIIRHLETFNIMSLKT